MRVGLQLEKFALRFATLTSVDAFKNELEHFHELAYRDGFADGFEDGRYEGRQEALAECEREHEQEPEV